MLLFFLVLRSFSVHGSFFGRSVWWQRGLIGISLAVVYFPFVSLINFSPRDLFYLCRGAYLGNVKNCVYLHFA